MIKVAMVLKKRLYLKFLNFSTLTNLDLVKFTFCANDNVDCVEPLSTFNSLQGYNRKPYSFFTRRSSTFIVWFSFHYVGQSAKAAEHSTISCEGKNKPPYHCSTCNIDGHSDRHCYEKIGYPPSWKHNLGPNKNRRGTCSRDGRGSRSTISRSHPSVAVVASPSESQPPVNLS
jgi:hypothetical protein